MTGESASSAQDRRSSSSERAPHASWLRLTTDELTTQLDTSASDGLSRDEAQLRLEQHGANVLATSRRRGALGMFADQFRDFMIAVLLGAAVVSGLVGEPQDTIAIVVIVLLNAVIGTVQQYRAERAVAALRQLGSPRASVIRGGERLELDASELVPGDLVCLSAGISVPADLRIVEAMQLRIDESLLTGESVPVDKHDQPLQATEVPTAEQRNMAFRGTLVAHGRARGIVVASGMKSEIGSIASLLDAQTSEQTPLQKRLAAFGRRLALAVLCVSAIVFVAGILRGEPPVLMFLTAVSLAVAAIPEALPAVVTVALALGARSMSRQHALIRHLPAVETLGSVSTICSDKTGTLTQNRMHAERFDVGDDVRDSLPTGDAGMHWRRLGEALALSHDVSAAADGTLQGDPTEVALHRVALDAGLPVSEWRKRLPRVMELPFDATRKRMTTVHGGPAGSLILCKGSPEQLLPQCSHRIAADGQPAPLDADALLARAEALACQGYRVLAFAARGLQERPESLQADSLERDLGFVGLVGLIDPPRAEAAAAVAECKRAGITPVMVTGDHPGTARAIARRLGIADDDAEVLTGADLAKLSRAELEQRAPGVRIFARVSPAQKIAIVEALQAGGRFVAMTGDGVNDGPALKRADIGVAMGRKGTDVAREAADMVLLDDDFATIVRAVHEGRRIFDNVRKFITYTMSSNSGEIWTLFLAPILGLPIPLLPIHILWINLVTDGLPGLAYTAERAEPGIMRRPPRPPDESVFSHGMGARIVWVGLLVGVLSIGAQAWAIDRSAAHWQTIVFMVLTLSQLFNSLAVRAERASLWSLGLLSNRPMIGAVLATLALQLAVVYWPPAQRILHTQALPPYDLGVCVAISSLVLWAVETEKWLARRNWLHRERSVRS